MIVVDASAVIEVLLRTASASVIEARLFHPGQSLHAPHLIDVEVTHALRRLALRGEIDDTRGRDALADLADMPIRRYPHALLLATAWSLRSNVTAYDAMYVALAEALGAPLLTRDQRLATTAGRFVTVEAVQDL